MIIGVIGAFDKEVMSILPHLGNVTEYRVAGRTFYKGSYNGNSVVLVLSQWGKVSAALTASVLITEFHVSNVLFFGTAGALASSVNVGDIVVTNRLAQHDYDSRPLHPRFYVPSIRSTWTECDKELHRIALEAVQETLEKENISKVFHSDMLNSFGMTEPKCFEGDIVSGDQFIGSIEQKHEITSALPTVLCAEMEGAAVGQVCVECQVPFIVVRCISDKADGTAHVDFLTFADSVPPIYAENVITRYLQKLTTRQ